MFKKYYNQRGSEVGLFDDSTLTYHKRERAKHSHLAEENGSKKQKEKARKHFHKKYQTIKIANLLGFEVCEECGGLR